MPIIDDRLDGYIPLDEFREDERERTSRRIWDHAHHHGKAVSGNLIPFEMNFGDVAIDELSAPQQAVVVNNGLKPLPIRTIRVVGDYVMTTDCPPVLPVGATCLVSISFNPKRAGLSTGGVYMDTGDAAGQEFVKLRGSGGKAVIDPTDPDPDPDPEYPDIDPVDPTNPDPIPDPEVPEALSVVLPSALAFGTVLVDANSAAKSFTLKNNGTERLGIASIAPSEADFTQTNNCGNGLNPGASCTINVKFAPKSVGAKAANIIVDHNGTGARSIGVTGTGSTTTPTLPVISISDGEIEVRDTGGAPSFSLPSSSISLGSAPFGETAEGTIVIGGDTSGPVLLETLPSNGGGFSFGYSASPTGPFTAKTSHEIAAGGILYVRATASGAPGSYNRTLIFASATQTASMGISATLQPEVVVPTMKRIRIAGNQFYEAQTGADDGGTLPQAGGIRLKSVNWFGAEGGNFTPHGTWMVNWKGILDQIKGWGFNCVRLPFSGQMANSNPQIPSTAIDYDVNPDLIGKSAFQVLDMIITYCEEIGLYVVLDHHRRSAGAGADGAPTDGSYTLANWKAAWGVMAARYKDRINVVGADVHNEPHDLDWSTWAGLVEEVGNHIHTVAPEWIIFCEGVGGSGADSYWWGGQLKGVATRPVVLTKPYRVAYSPHEYGQSVGTQQWQKKDGNIPVNWPLNQAQIWNDFWGYIFYDNIAPIWIGEMGGHFGLDGNGALTKPHRTEETEWMSYLVRYLNFDKNTDGTLGGQEAPQGGRKGISFAWWSYNPNSGDTGGLVRDDWVTPQTPKLNLIADLLISN